VRAHISVYWLNTLGLVGCLPGDHRPEPASIYMAVEPSVAVLAGHTTDDGWTIRYERFVTALGDVRLSNEECTAYGETHYEWLFDFAAVTESHKVGLAYALGKCSVSYRMRGPSDDTVRGGGVTANDVRLMRIEESDEHAERQEMTLWAIGKATQGDVTKRFEWKFRNAYKLSKCQQPTDPEARHITNMTLEGGQMRAFSVTIRPEELFREQPDDDAPVLFDAYAAADTDGDGWVTLEELDEVPADPDALADESYEHLDEFDGLEDDASLADYVYQVLLPRVSRLVGGGVCLAKLRRPHRH